MNINHLLVICLLLAVSAMCVMFVRPRREECHNAKKPKEEDGNEAPNPAPGEEEGKSSDGQVKDAEPVVDLATAPATLEELPKHPLQEQAEAEIAAMNPTAAPKGISEEEIIAKIRAGLTRDQAIEVITNQRAHDEALAKQG